MIQTDEFQHLPSYYQKKVVEEIVTPENTTQANPDGSIYKRKFGSVKAYNLLLVMMPSSLETFISKPSLGLEQGRKESRTEHKEQISKVKSGYDPP